MKLSREKIVHLSHLMIEDLVKMDEVDFIEDRNTIRLEIVRIVEELLREEEQIDSTARQKILSQKRTIPEGTQEWDILYRRYYSEELKRLGIG